jgi:multiple antibiotic resistance protein
MTRIVWLASAMEDTFRHIFLCFVPLFVAVDAIGVLPMFTSLTEGLEGPVLRRVIRQSVITAAVVGISFLAIGKALLGLLGISVPDFMVAGGTLLFVVSMSDLLRAEKVQRQVDPDSLGAVPIGVPLITGPAVLTTSILLLNEYGVLPTSIALVLNIFIAGLVFRSSESLQRFLGQPGTKTVSKIASLLLASIAVMIVRKGIESFFVGRMPG